jgi:dethiobiotin synthetase
VRGLFITGTDTNIGKTAVSAALLHRYRKLADLCYWKPIQTGFPIDDDTATVSTLGQCSAQQIGIEGVRLPRPLSPHLAAKYSGTEIDVQALIRLARKYEGSRCFIVEGAGGVLVPLNTQQLMIDFISELSLPALIVAGTQLGTINHTLLTIMALRSRSIPVAGVVLVGEPNADNRRSIEVYGNVSVLGEMPRFAELTPGALGSWASTQLDPDGVLQKLLTEVLP